MTSVLTDILNDKFIDFMLLVILLGAFLYLTIHSPAEDGSCNSSITDSNNILNKTSTPTAIATAIPSTENNQKQNQIEKIKKELKFNINDMTTSEGLMNDITLASEYGWHNDISKLRPLVNFHEKFRLNARNQIKEVNPIIISDLNNSKTLYVEAIDNKNTKQRRNAIPELGWRNWWLRQKSNYKVTPDTNFKNIPTKSYLDKLENTNNIYLD